MAAQQSMIENLVRRSDLDPVGETANASAPQPDPFAWGALQQSSAAFGELLSTALDVQKNLSAQMCGAPHDPLITQMLGKIFDLDPGFPRRRILVNRSSRPPKAPGLPISGRTNASRSNWRTPGLACARRVSITTRWPSKAGCRRQAPSPGCSTKRRTGAKRSNPGGMFGAVGGDGERRDTERQRSTPFLETQREVLNAATQYRSAQQEISNS